jgi:hypothetical protein
MLAVAFLFASLSATNVPSAANEPERSELVAGRDGEREALADLREGNPLKLYYYWRWGERLTLPTPGISDCDAEQGADPKVIRSVFVSLPELTMSESKMPTTEQRARQHAALSFARAYNQHMFRHRKAQILKICRRANLEE